LLSHILRHLLHHLWAELRLIWIHHHISSRLLHHHVLRISLTLHWHLSLHPWLLGHLHPRRSLLAHLRVLSHHWSVLYHHSRRHLHPRWHLHPRRHLHTGWHSLHTLRHTGRHSLWRHALLSHPARGHLHPRRHLHAGWHSLHSLWHTRRHCHTGRHPLHHLCHPRSLRIRRICLRWRCPVGILRSLTLLRSVLSLHLRSLRHLRDIMCRLLRRYSGSVARSWHCCGHCGDSTALLHRFRLIWQLGCTFSRQCRGLLRDHTWLNFNLQAGVIGRLIVL
jgi:hypothetical protein